ncbi:MAG: TonB-dependent receptor [Gammaproteobacteria bacterium]|nr:TonB-dependent receptor [Gammaproteobacteria bacterium]
MKSLPISLLAMNICFTSLSAFAQEEPQEVVITANRVSQPANVVMAATTIINRETINSSQSQSLIELLSGQPGMHIAQSGGLGAQASLFMRGTESDHTLVLIDGVQITTGTGASGRLEAIPLDQIERIEIVRGPRSSIYGSEAIGGVLNIITSSAVEPGFSGNLSVTAGTQGSNNTNLGLQGGNDSTTLALNLSHRQTDGINSRESGSADDDGFENDTVALSLNHQFTNRVSFSANYSRFDSTSDYDDGMVDIESQQLSAGFSVALTDSWNSSITIERFKEDNDDRSAFGTTQSKSENNKINWHNTLVLDNTNQFSFGLDHVEQELEYANFGAVQTDTTRDNGGIYGVYLRDSALADLTLSLRHDDNERFGNQTTGSIALGKDLSQNVRAWVSYGTAFKAPNLIDLYVDFPSFFFFANPNLKPETSENLELGLQIQALASQWKINAFRNDIDDLIGSDSTFTSLANVQKVRINGLEVSVETLLAGWYLNADLTILDHENQSTNQELLRRPNQTLTLNVARSFGDYDFAVKVLAQSDHHDIDPMSFGPSMVGGFATTDVVLGYRLNEAMRFRLRVANAFDKDYQFVDGFYTQGRSVQLAFDYRF